MDAFVESLAEIPSSYRTAALIAGVTTFWLVESIVPLFQMQYGKWKHAGLNLTLTFLQLIISVSFGILVIRTAIYVGDHQLGLLYWLGVPTWLHIVLGIMAIDCAAGYWIHRIEHKVPWMWRCHIVHHADHHVDVTTALRHHPIETVFRFVAQWIAVAVFGVPLGILFLYQLVAVFFAQLTHANLRSIEPLDRGLSWIFVTPNMHKIHHHEQQPLTDTNYGNIFSIWDRLFGTFAEVPMNELRYGIDSLPNESENNRLTSLLMLPFRKFERKSER